MPRNSKNNLHAKKADDAPFLASIATELGARIGGGTGRPKDDSGGVSPALLTLATPAPARSAKLCETIAEFMQRDISAMGWPIGAILGNEVQLMQRYGVSRATTREAIRQLERNGVATMRRGGNGGLVIQQPARVSAALALSTYMELTDVSYVELFEAREILEVDAMVQATENIHEEDIERTRAVISELRASPMGSFGEEAAMHARMRDLVGDLTHNPATALILESIHYVTINATRPKLPLKRLMQIMQTAREHKIAQLTAIVDGNVFRAHEIVREQLKLGRSLIESQLNRSTGRRHARTISLESSPDIACRQVFNKTAHRLAVTIARFIVEKPLPPGHRLGSEFDLQARYKVSRAVLREALRLLEIHSIIRGQRGEGGGLIVHLPDPAYTISVALTYLRFSELKRHYFFKVWKSLQLAAVELAARRLDASNAARLSSAIEAARNAAPGQYSVNSLQIDLMVADASANRAVSLFSRLLGAMGASYPAAPPPLAVLERLGSSHQAMANAVLSQDPARARLAMLRYFKIIDVWYGQAARARLTGMAETKPG